MANEQQPALAGTGKRWPRRLAAILGPLVLGSLLAFVASCSGVVRPLSTFQAPGPAAAALTTVTVEAVAPPEQVPPEAPPFAQVTPATPRPLPTAARRPAATPTPRPPTLVNPIPTPAITAQMAVILDEDSGAVLWGHDEHREVAPASLTKIMTALVAIERGNPAARVTTDVDSRVMYDSTVMGLRPGEEVSLEDLLYGLMLPSGNDAALAIGRHIAGSDEAFVQLMNERVRSLRLMHTQFRNAHGLDAEGHYSSAYDMAMLSREAMRDPLFQRLAAAREWSASGFLQSYRLINLNRMIGRYPGADGVKIGYTDDAGRTMVVSAKRDGHRVYASFMRSANLVADGTALLDYAFEAYSWAR